jgi:hypothetical protein
MGSGPTPDEQRRQPLRSNLAKTGGFRQPFSLVPDKLLKGRNVLLQSTHHNSTPKPTARSLSNWWPRSAAKTPVENGKQGNRP